MYDGIKIRIFTAEIKDSRPVTEIEIFESRPDACNLLNTDKNLYPRINEIINNDDLIS
jgi:hypothetical protein